MICMTHISLYLHILHSFFLHFFNCFIIFFMWFLCITGVRACSCYSIGVFICISIDIDAKFYYDQFSRNIIWSYLVLLPVDIIFTGTHLICILYGEENEYRFSRKKNNTIQYNWRPQMIAPSIYSCLTF